MASGSVRPCSKGRKEESSPEKKFNFLLELPPEMFEEFILKMGPKDVANLCASSKAFRERCGDRVW